jgi:hypothetical protein
MLKDPRTLLDSPGIVKSPSKMSMGSTGDSPVPSGDSPDGMTAARPGSNKYRPFLSPPLVIPVGESPRTRGGDGLVPTEVAETQGIAGNEAVPGSLEFQQSNWGRQSCPHSHRGGDSLSPIARCKSMPGDGPSPPRKELVLSHSIAGHAAAPRLKSNCYPSRGRNRNRQN